MKNKKLLVVGLAVSILLPGILGTNTYAYAEGSKEEIKRTYEFTSTDPTETHDEQFSDVISEGDSYYTLENVAYKISEGESIKEDKEVTRTIAVTGNETVEPQITEDGITYVFDTKHVTSVGSSEVVTGYTDYDYAVSVASVPQTKVLQGGVTGTLTGVAPSTTEQVDSYINITFISYDADLFDWQGIEVEKSDPNPLAGYESQLLASVGEDASTASVLSCTWNGDEYTSADGVLCRDALATIRKTVNWYRASYSGSVSGDTTYEVTYKGTKQVDTGEKYYHITATALYQKAVMETSYPKGFYVVAGIGIFLIATLMVVILFLLSRMRKESKDGSSSK